MPSHNKSDANLEGWFVNHSLPWNDNIVKFLLNQVVELVDHIKVLKKGLFLEQFVGEKTIVQAMAKITLKELGGSDTFSFSRASTRISLEPSPVTTTKAKANTTVNNANSNNILRANTTNSVLDFGGNRFTMIPRKTGSQKKLEREERRRNKKLQEQFGVINVESVEDDPDGIGVEKSVPSSGGLITPPKLTVPLLAIIPKNYHSGR